LVLLEKSKMENQSDYVGLFSPIDACGKEISQLSSSGCGITAIANVLVALGITNCDKIRQFDWSNCILRKRDNNGSLPAYLASRGVAGCTGQDLITSMDIITSENSVCTGEFYSANEILHTRLCLISSANIFHADMCISVGMDF
jgi:hypothetical protein